MTRMVTPPPKAITLVASLFAARSLAMSGSPYHLGPSVGRRSRDQQSSSSTTILASNSGFADAARPLRDGYSAPLQSHFALSVDTSSNPLVQAQLGMYASRYSGARSLALPHMEEDFTARRSAQLGGSWSHLHPLQQQASVSKQGPSRSSIPHMIQSQLSPTQGLTASLWTNLGNQFVRVASALHRQESGRQPESHDFGFHQFSDSPKKAQLNKSLRKAIQFVLPVFALVLLSQTGLVPIGRSGRWSRLDKRKLNGRQCVMNMFVDKQAKDEFNPDFVADPTKVVNVTVSGTYRTKGQLKVISRFMSAVADSFRSRIELEQHVIFTGNRDGGHLANEALRLWPPRGSYRTQLHVFAAASKDAIYHQHLGGLEDRFKGKGKHIHLYDHVGRRTGMTSEDDDEEDRDGDEDDEDKKDKDRDPKYDYEPENEGELPELQTILFPEMKIVKKDEDREKEDDEEEKDDIVIPYMHVDGSSMKDQMEILSKATSLLESKKVVVVGLEHSPDMKIEEIIEFFRELQYKTFMVGVRQLTRIDNLCPEVLDNMLNHPNLKKKNGVGSKPEDPRYPPFFVAMPKGRRSQEEMTVQHMYDLFSGSGGGGQVKTANDRKAPGK